MALVAKRKVSATWREAVSSRAAEAGLRDVALATYQARLDEGLTEAEAAFLALKAHGLLWTVKLPGDPADAEQLSDVPTT